MGGCCLYFVFGYWAQWLLIKNRRRCSRSHKNRPFETIDSTEEWIVSRAGSLCGYQEFVFLLLLPCQKGRLACIAEAGADGVHG